ncbi:hypothetical protein PPTG_22123 [Phytophthora nicotianae INRA-310]|uniref:Uncharacterized protein n=2 Tax=Phytophthora nicotianae TaxID=4792 RepID=W2QNA7_PHYN3|nr:hypothetical protein PPTG_22123 [Phytophthora nicotianae INRA-310]ETN14436.1 hypothetical protein PPTG_22123 [Phytophthora nicotianae INRA-310]
MLNLLHTKFPKSSLFATIWCIAQNNTPRDLYIAMTTWTPYFIRIKLLVEFRATYRHRAIDRKWLYDYYQQHPLAYMDQARDAFTRMDQTSILIASVGQ